MIRRTDLYARRAVRRRPSARPGGRGRPAALAWRGFPQGRRENSLIGRRAVRFAITLSTAFYSRSDWPTFPITFSTVFYSRSDWLDPCAATGGGSPASRKPTARDFRGKIHVKRYFKEPLEARLACQFQFVSSAFEAMRAIRSCWRTQKSIISRPAGFLSCKPAFVSPTAIIL